jgi:NAD-dependent deacetylase
MEEAEIPPRCPKCGGLLRPDVVLFGETLPTEKVEQLYEELDAGFDVVFSIGTTSVFPYIMQPVLLAGQLGWTTVEINPAESRVSHMVDFRLPVGAGEALEAIWEQLRRQ